MSRLRIFADDRPEAPLSTTHDALEIAAALTSIGAGFERWGAAAPVRPGDAPATVLAAYNADVERICAARDLPTVDVVSVAPDHPQREAMRAKFLDEHTHVEDEVRFFAAGSGLFSLHVGGRVFEVLCEAGDLLAVPGGTAHWFDMGPSPSFIAIRFFRSPDGWVGHFTGTDIARRFPRYER